MATELDDWETLLTHPGYLRLLTYARQEWADGFNAKIKLAIVNARTQQRDVAVAVETIDAQNDAINALLSVPQMRIQQLLTKQAEPDPSRRGGL